MTAKRSAAKVEKADRRASRRLNGKRRSWPVRLIGAANEIGDQPQMRLQRVIEGIAKRLRKDGDAIDA